MFSTVASMWNSASDDMDESSFDRFQSNNEIGDDIIGNEPVIFSTFEHEFWKSFAEDNQLFDATIPFDPADAGGGGMWNSRFVPPPPRPPFMDESSVMTDGLTTCDLCSWAVQEKNAFSLEGSFEAAGELGWAFSIGLVSVVSALIGAIIMITLVRCKRLKSNPHHINTADGRGPHLLPWWCRKSNDSHTTSTDHHLSLPKQRPAESLPSAHANPQVWIWLKNVNTPPTPEPMPMFPPSASIENYYTNTDDSCISSPCKVNEVVYEEISGIG